MSMWNTIANSVRSTARKNAVANQTKTAALISKVASIYEPMASESSQSEFNDFYSSVSDGVKWNLEAEGFTPGTVEFKSAVKQVYLALSKFAQTEFSVPEVVTSAGEARSLAIDWQNWMSEQNLSMGEFGEWESYFAGLAQQFPELREEFVENAIIGEDSGKSAALDPRDDDYDVSGSAGDCLFCGSSDTEVISRNKGNGMYSCRCNACGRSFAVDEIEKDAQADLAVGDSVTISLSGAGMDFGPSAPEFIKGVVQKVTGNDVVVGDTLDDPSPMTFSHSMVKKAQVQDFALAQVTIQTPDGAVELNDPIAWNQAYENAKQILEGGVNPSGTAIGITFDAGTQNAATRWLGHVASAKTAAPKCFKCNSSKDVTVKDGKAKCSNCGKSWSVKTAQVDADSDPYHFLATHPSVVLPMDEQVNGFMAYLQDLGYASKRFNNVSSSGIVVSLDEGLAKGDQNDLDAALADFLGKTGQAEYGFDQEGYRGFSITTEHEGENGIVTGYTVSVDSEEASAASGEEIGSMISFTTRDEAKSFIDSELSKTAQFSPDDAPEPFGWIIDSVAPELDDIMGTDVGKENYSDPKPDISTYTMKFRLRDDDGNLYYEGRMTPSCLDNFGVGGGNPLDDFGMPNAGCTIFQYSTGSPVFRTAQVDDMSDLGMLEGQEVRLYNVSPSSFKEFGGVEPDLGVVGVNGGHLWFDGVDHGAIGPELASALFDDMYENEFGYLPGSDAERADLEAEFGSKVAQVDVSKYEVKRFPSNGATVTMSRGLGDTYSEEAFHAVVLEKGTGHMMGSVTNSSFMCGAGKGAPQCTDEEIIHDVVGDESVFASKTADIDDIYQCRECGGTHSTPLLLSNDKRCTNKFHDKKKTAMLHHSIETDGSTSVSIVTVDPSDSTSVHNSTFTETVGQYTDEDYPTLLANMTKKCDEMNAARQSESDFLNSMGFKTSGQGDIQVCKNCGSGRVVNDGKVDGNPDMTEFRCKDCGSVWRKKTREISAAGNKWFGIWEDGQYAGHTYNTGSGSSALKSHKKDISVDSDDGEVAVGSSGGKKYHAIDLDKAYKYNDGGKLKKTAGRVMLLTQEILSKVPPLYSQDGLGMSALVYGKFFCPDASPWTWYMTEYSPVAPDGTPREAFGYVVGLDSELGYFNMDELESVTGPMGLNIERDTSFPIGQYTLSDVMSGKVAQSVGGGNDLGVLKDLAEDAEKGDKDAEAELANRGFTVDEVKKMSSKTADKKCPECGSTDTTWLDAANHYVCANCGIFFGGVLGDKTATTNEDVIQMFAADSFPKDKMPSWGTSNLKIQKQPNGWALVNYSTPIVYRDSTGKVFFNSRKYSPTTSTIQNVIRGYLNDFTEVDEAGINSAIKTAKTAKMFSVWGTGYPQHEIEAADEAEAESKYMAIHPDAKKFDERIIVNPYEEGEPRRPNSTEEVSWRDAKTASDDVEISGDYFENGKPRRGKVKSDQSQYKVPEKHTVVDVDGHDAVVPNHLIKKASRPTSSMLAARPRKRHL